MTRWTGSRKGGASAAIPGHDLAEATALGIVDRYQQHEIPQISVSITQYDQHQVRCGCGLWGSRSRPGACDLREIGVLLRRGMIVNVSSRLLYLIFIQLLGWLLLLSRTPCGCPKLRSRP
jgi:hypothetical protein